MDLTEKELLINEKIKAEIKRAEAEADDFKASAVKFLAEAKEKEANASKYLLEMELTKYEVIQERLRAEDNEREAKEKLAANKYHHVYYFSEEVNQESSQKCMTELAYWMRTAPKCDVEIVFSSPGGEVMAGMALFDYIQQLRRSGHKVTTGSIGYAASMAGILLQAGENRWIGKEAYILIHEISTLAIGKTGDIEDELKFVKKIQERVLNIFEERCQQAGKNKTASKPLLKAQLKEKWSRKDWWIESSEALMWGLVDEIR